MKPNQKELFPHSYAILRDPGHNRVFYRESLEPSLAELKLSCERLDTPCSKPENTEIGGISYLVFDSSDELNDRDLRILSRLSFAFAIFEIAQEKKAEISLIPIAKSPIHYLDPGISSLVKYRGKTNELFTRMMLNVALLASGIEPGKGIRLLDPVAGRGTTLFEAMALGMDAFGIEQDRTAVHESTVFLRQYLESERFKHRLSRKQVDGSGKRNAVFSQEFSYTRSKEEFREQEEHRTTVFIHGDARDAHRYFKKQYFDLIVGDLPYGISHGNRTGTQGGKTRNPLELLEACLPSWLSLLKPGGAVALAWNVNVLPLEKVRELFREHGFLIPEGESYKSFEHQVDRAIKRDILVALKQDGQ